MSKDSPHIAFLTPALGNGGTGKIRIHLANELVQRGIRVDLLLGRLEGPYVSALNNGMHVVDLGTSHAITCLPRLIHYVLKERPTALITDRIRVAVAALRARRLANMKSLSLFNSVHISLSEKLKHLTPGKQKSERASIGRVFHPTDGIIAVSKGIAEDITRTFNIPCHKVHVIYNPVIAPEIFLLAQERINLPWRDNERHPVILSAGRLEPPKDYDTLIRAFANLHRRRPCRLIILGEGKERPPRLESLVKDLGLSENDVSLPGFVTNPYAYMSQSDLFVMSSTAEGFGKVLVEALALGIPVVASDCPFGPREILPFIQQPKSPSREMPFQNQKRYSSTPVP